MKIGIVVFPGTNRERDVAQVTGGLLGCPTQFLWHQQTDLADSDVVILPGGFSYGDYLRCGAVARFSPIMQAVRQHAERGGYILGICNGFQVLTESGLLPGALVRNRDLKFICDWVHLRVENTRSLWTSGYQAGQVLSVPVAHGEGCYYADPDTIQRLEDNQQVVVRYANEQGECSDAANINGSLNHIAGICNERGNVVGLMPHPENACDSALGNTDGLKFFEGMVAEALALT
jgi:phosphoribosylformylglycinamidine synthase subunit PurQ / glutaminase